MQPEFSDFPRSFGFMPIVPLKFADFCACEIAQLPPDKGRLLESTACKGGARFCSHPQSSLPQGRRGDSPACRRVRHRGVDKEKKRYNSQAMKPFEVIPAIDLRGGYAVRLRQGDYAQETRYHDDPIALAQHWAQQGAPRLHLVDLDGALAGYPVQLELIRRILRAVAIPVQVGGGVRSEEAVRALLEAGADRVIVGTLAVELPDIAETIFRKYGARVALALDVKSGRAASAGWQSVSETPYLLFAQQMAQRGAPRIIFTQVERDGTLQGVDQEPLLALLQAVAVPVIVSGGVRDASDLAALRTLAQTTTLEGVVVGRALYEGALDNHCWHQWVYSV